MYFIPGGCASTKLTKIFFSKKHHKTIQLKLAKNTTNKYLCKINTTTSKKTYTNKNDNLTDLNTFRQKKRFKNINSMQ